MGCCAKTRWCGVVAATAIVPVLPVIEPVTVSVAVTVRLPASVRVVVKDLVPASPETKACWAGASVAGAAGEVGGWGTAGGAAGGGAAAIVPVLPVIEPVTVSVAVTARLPASFSVAEKLPAPLVSVASAGSTALAPPPVK